MLTDFDFPCGLWDRPDTGSRAGARGALRISRIWHILKILMSTRAIPQNIQNLDILDIPHCCYHQQPKELKSSDRIGPQQKANWRSFWPESTFWQSFRSASSELLSGLLCFTPAATTRSTDLFGCSNAPVANKSKYTGRCCFLLQRWGATTVPFRGTYLRHS